jgi:lipoprotein signal peptidase
VGLRRHPARERLIDGLLAFHRNWAWAVIAANGLAGLLALVAWKVPARRGSWWVIATALAEVALVVQVTTGALLVSDETITAPRIHMFYGFVGFATVGIAYSSRDSMRGRLEMLYGAVGLFLMGVGIRATLTR